MHGRDDNLEPLALMALDAMPQSVLIADMGGRIVMRNAAARRVLPAGGALGDALGHDGSAVLDWQRELAMLEDAGGALRHTNMTVDGAGRSHLALDVELALLPAPGDAAQAKAKATTTAAAGARVGRAARRDGRRVVVVATDVSARLSMEKRLMASERLAAIGELAAKVAHELNNPLDGVLRYIGLAQRGGVAASGRHLDKAREGLMRMARIVRGLLEQGHPRQGRFSASLEELLREAVAVMLPRAQAQGVTIETDLRDPEACAEGSLFQVFCNIIKNALDAMPAGGLLKIRQRTSGREASVEFADNGSGIDPADLAKVFEPFYTTKRPGEGSGLGLAICREIVTRLGGRISAAAGAEGGAVIALSLPLRIDARAPQAPLAPVSRRDRRSHDTPGGRPERTKP